MAQKKRTTARKTATKRKPPITKTHTSVDAFEKRAVAKAAVTDYTKAMRGHPQAPKGCSAVMREHKDGRRLKFTVFVPKSCQRFL